MYITRGKVGKFDWFSRPRATELITVPNAQGMAKYAIPPIVYPGTTEDGFAEKALMK